MLVWRSHCGQRSRVAHTTPPACASTDVEADRASSVLLPDMFEPVTSRTFRAGRPSRRWRLGGRRQSADGRSPPRQHRPLWIDFRYRPMPDCHGAPSASGESASSSPSASSQSLTWRPLSCAIAPARTARGSPRASAPVRGSARSPRRVRSSPKPRMRFSLRMQAGADRPSADRRSRRPAVAPNARGAATACSKIAA